MIFPKELLSYKILLITLFAMTVSHAQAQIGFKGGKYKSFITEYNSSYNQDSTFVLDYIKTNGVLTRDITVDSLFVNSPKAGSTFTWYRLDNQAKAITASPIGNKASLNITQQGGYQVNIQQGAWDTTCIAWVFFHDTLSVTDVKIKESNCSSFLLNSVVTVGQFKYADPLTGDEKIFDEKMLRKIQWSPSGMRDPLAASTRVVSLYKPSIKNTTYTITVSDIFKHQVSGSVYYESIIPEADFTFEHQVVDKVDNGTVTPRWDAVNEADSISAIALVKFKNASTNAQKYVWTLTDTLLGRYTPEPVKIDTADLSYSPEYKYYIPRSYKPMLIAINTKQGCRDTVVYKTDDENTKKFLVNIGNSTFFQTSGEMPNVFTPNGDGENDYYRPELRSVKSFHMYVYNRLGRKIYEYAHNENEPLDLWPGWDGKLSNGDMIKQGTYVIVIQARGWDGVAYRTKKYSSLVAVF